MRRHQSPVNGSQTLSAQTQRGDKPAQKTPAAQLVQSTRRFQVAAPPTLFDVISIKEFINIAVIISKIGHTKTN